MHSEEQRNKRINQSFRFIQSFCLFIIIEIQKKWNQNGSNKVNEQNEQKCDAIRLQNFFSIHMKLPL